MRNHLGATCVGWAAIASAEGVSLVLFADIMRKVRRGAPWSADAESAMPAAVPRRRLSLPGDPELIYAVGDVHGCLTSLKKLEAMIVEDGAWSSGLKLIVMLGDYVDRGPESAGVLDHLIAPPPDGFRRVCLCGNHEDIFQQFLEGQISFESWRNFGGDQTLLSYGFDIRGTPTQGALRDSALGEIRKAIPATHRAFIRSLPAALSTTSYFFAHAGVRPGIGLADQKESDLLWIRDRFLRSEAPLEKIVVYGHTPVPEPVVAHSRIGIDTGAYMGGALTAARLYGGTVAFLQAR